MYDKTKKTKQGFIYLAHVDVFGLSEADGGKWVLMCDAHDEFIQDTNKQRLWSHATESYNWCMTCQENHYAKVGA